MDGPPPVEISECLSAQARLAWGAEEANAARIASRTNLVLTVIGAILGLNVVTGAGAIDVMLDAPWYLALPFWVLLPFSLAVMLYAAWVALEVRWDRPSTGPASRHLHMGIGSYEELGEADRELLAWAVYAKTRAGARELGYRNRERNTMLTRRRLRFCSLAPCCWPPMSRILHREVSLMNETNRPSETPNGAPGSSKASATSGAPEQVTERLRSIIEDAKKTDEELAKKEDSLDKRRGFLGLTSAV